MTYKRRKYHKGDTHLKKGWRTKRRTKDLDEVSLDPPRPTWVGHGHRFVTEIGLSYDFNIAVYRIADQRGHKRQEREGSAKPGSRSRQAGSGTTLLHTLRVSTFLEPNLNSHT